LPATGQNVRVFNGDTEVPASSVSVQGNAITVSSALHDGRNDIVVLASDSQNRALSYAATLWAGSRTLTVSVVKADGSVPANALVVARLLDQQGVAMQQSTTTGQVKFENVPDRTILLSATADGGQSATLSTIGAAGNVELRLQGFALASTVDNNDFSQGTAGWLPGINGAISIVPHVEQITPATQAAAAPSHALSVAPPADRNLIHQARKSQAMAGSLGGLASAQVATSDLDLALTTSGEGPSTVSRTFKVPAGASQVKIRYRFITSEVPGGYFGSQYNDSFSIQVRSQQGGGAASDANSMNSLGLAAFDAGGSTTWRVLTLPVSQQGDTIQVDAIVTNVGDGLLDSQVVVDYVAVEAIGVTSSLTTACVNQTVTFQATGSSAPSASWSGGQSPATGTGATFATRFTTHGDYAVTATAAGASAQRSVHIRQPSGPAWVQQFPESVLLTDLVAPFSTNATNFVSAMRTAGASVTISTTYRPEQRAFLMHYAGKIATQGLNPENVPERDDIDICWTHRNAAGEVDLGASRAAAQAMMDAYHIAFPAALHSRHTQRRAVDMTITWSGNLTIRGANGNDVVISTTPRTGADNTNLHAVGAGYGVHKLVGDRPHWSDDGH
jgi:hypothetical protein